MKGYGSQTKVGKLKRECIEQNFRKKKEDENYVRFVNSRHPLSRVLSAWRQKFDKHFKGAKARVGKNLI